MSDVTSFENGVNDALTGLWNEFGQLDPRRYTVFFEDFQRYVAGDWTITKTELGAGSATHVVTNEHAGVLLITNDNADDDNVFYQRTSETFRFATGKKAFFEARIRTSDATQSDIVVGLQITDTTPLDVTDGVFFLKPDGQATVNFHVEKDNVQASASGVATMANNTYVRLGFYYDGASSFRVFVDNVHVATVTPGTSFPDDEELTISFGIQNGEAVAKTKSVDYIMFAMER